MPKNRLEVNFPEGHNVLLAVRNCRRREVGLVGDYTQTYSVKSSMKMTQYRSPPCATDDGNAGYLGSYE